MRVYVSLAAAFLILLVAGCKEGSSTSNQPAVSTNEILIGEYGSMTGATATFGTSSHEGLLLALDEINGSGGVLGKQIRVISEDDQSKADEAVNAVQKLINRDRVVAVVGEVASKRSLAAGNVCEKYQIPMVSPASTNPDVTKGKKWVFRTCFTDDFQGTVNGEFAAKRGWKKVAILTDVNNDYSKGLGKYFRQAYEKVGQLVADESYREGDKDFKAQLTKIKAANPDAVFVPGYYTDIGLILRQARELGLTMPVFGGDGWDSPDTLALGPVADGCFYTDHYSPEDPSPQVQNFISAYQKKFNKVPDAMAILGYDAMRVVADAIKRAGKAEPAAIRDALEQTKDFPGASGSITIDQGHNARKPIKVLEIRGGKTKLTDSILPGA
ncbi:MAG TPA: ABC transporter substrate-binding protein [Tepidisphaeraceae bacterium]|jgi:branched-chain amino acid transport system substrate-binding protein